MTWKDGNTALAALILALGCHVLSARGQEMDGRPHVFAETLGQMWQMGQMAYPADDPANFGFPPGLHSSGFSGDGPRINASNASRIAFVADEDDPMETPGAIVFPKATPDFSFLDRTPGSSGDIEFLVSGQSFYRPSVALRLGWWQVETEGDLTKVGEYQDLDSLPFFDADMLHSDGLHTIDMSASGLDTEASQARIDYFGPWLQADVDFQRYLHRLDHDPLTNMGGLQSGDLIVSQDLDAGDDYAIRVQRLKTSFRGKLGKRLKLRLNFHVLRKQGDRQANAAHHCFPGVPQNFSAVVQNHCHVLSQGQQIDWVTVKFEPVVEGRFGPVHVEYSRPMRVFNQNDQIVTRSFGLHFPSDEPYAVVPDSYTQTDRLKLGVDLGAATRFYARLQTGDTHNKTRQTHRRFHGFDLRLTNKSFDGVSLTGYANVNEQRNQDVPFFLPDEQQALAVPTAIIPPYGIRHPVNYFRRTVGADASWKPFRYNTTFNGLTITTGAEQGLVERNFSEFVIQEPGEPPGPVVDQRRTAFTAFHVGASVRCAPGLDTYARYRLRVTKDPLFAVNKYYGFTNTSLPDEQSVVEIGSTWMLADNFLATATVGLENGRHHSEVADFNEESYPMTFTLWYAPTSKWSLSAGYGYYSNWIDQNITFPSDTPAVSVGDTRQWNYGGEGRVLSLGGSYAWTRRLTFSGGFQFVRARDAVDPLVPWPDLTGYFDVVVDRTRLTGGVDWLLGEHISAYVRYLYEDYEDKSVDYNSGTALMFLTGMSASY